MPVAQLALALQAEPTEHPAYLTDQLITYIGNKRGLLPFIGSGLTRARQLIGRDEVTFLDLFAGSGVVSRYAKQVLPASGMDRRRNVRHRPIDRDEERVSLLLALWRRDLHDAVSVIGAPAKPRRRSSRCDAGRSCSSLHRAMLGAAKRRGAQGRSRTTDTTIFSRLLYH